jgi:predicted small secreted protein
LSNIIVEPSLTKILGDFDKVVTKVFLVIALAVLSFVLVGCQTVQGLGKDITWTGEKGSELVGQDY